MKRLLTLILLLSAQMSACSVHALTRTGVQTAAPGMPIATLERCSPAQLTAETIRVNKLMDKFDHYASRASESQQSQLIQIIPQMQHLLRDAQDQEVPACLQSLKELQTAHMDMMIQVLIYLNGHPHPQHHPIPT